MKNESSSFKSSLTKAHESMLRKGELKKLRADVEQRLTSTMVLRKRKMKNYLPDEVREVMFGNVFQELKDKGFVKNEIIDLATGGQDFKGHLLKRDVKAMIEGRRPITVYMYYEILKNLGSSINIHKCKDLFTTEIHGDRAIISRQYYPKFHINIKIKFDVTDYEMVVYDSLKRADDKPNSLYRYLINAIFFFYRSTGRELPFSPIDLEKDFMESYYTKSKKIVRMKRVLK